MATIADLLRGNPYKEGSATSTRRRTVGRPMPPINASERSMHPVEPPTDPYAVLGVLPSASIDEIKQAYWRTMHKYHPDLANSDDITLRVRWAVAINLAYEKLVSQNNGAG